MDGNVNDYGTARSYLSTVELSTSHKSEAEAYLEGDIQLTPAERIFVISYVETSNKTRAAIMAGYPEYRAADIARRLMSRPSINRAIEDYSQQICRKYGYTAERVLAEMWAIATSNIADFIEPVYNDKGDEVGRTIDIKDKTRRKLAAVSEIYQDRNGLRLKFYDKTAALTQLARITGLVDDNTMKVVGPDGGPLQIEHHNYQAMSTEELAQLYREKVTGNIQGK